MISTYSVRIFRPLVSQLSLRTVPKNVTKRTTNLRWCSQTLTSKVQTSIKSCQEENIRKIAKLINEYPNSESIKWRELEEQLSELNLREPRVVVFQACLRIKDLEAGMSYFNHVTKSGKDFTPVELVFFLKLCGTRTDSIIKYESVVKQAYDKIKTYLSSDVIQSYLLKMISEIPGCLYGLSKNICEEKKFHNGVHHLINKAFELKHNEIAFEMLNTFNININLVLPSYINYLCQMAMENKFSVDMITTIFKYCENNNNVISHSNYLYLSTTFFNTLKQYDKNYVWTLNKCGINCNICSNCKKKLIDKCISESDFNSLKEAFFPKAGLTEKNVFLSTTDKEINRFFKFLKDSKPYQMVVDGLNLMYKNKRTSNYISRPIKYFLDKEMDVLIIARRHAEKQFLRMSFLKKKQYKDRCQFFFTDNLSDDDLFTLYAALYGGLGTYFISGDFLQSYGSRFDGSLRKIYFKWKSYHQFVFKTDIISPLPSLGMSQLTSDENGKKLTWHISYSSENYMNDLLTPLPFVKWACLQAEKKSP